MGRSFAVLVTMIRVSLALVCSTLTLSFASAQSVDTPLLRVETTSHSAAIRRLAVDHARGWIFTASDDKTVRVWDRSTGQLLQVLRPPTGQGELGRMYGVALHPTSGKVAVAGTTGAVGGEHRIYIFDPQTGRMESSFDARGADIKRLVWTHDGTLLIAAYAGQNGIKAFSPTGQPVFEENYRGGVFGLAVSSDGSLVTTGQDKVVRVYRASGGTVAALRYFNTAVYTGPGSAHMGEPLSATISPDGKRVAIGFRYNSEPVQILDLSSGRSILNLEAPKLEPGNQWAVAWSTDGRSIYTAGTAHQAGFKFPVHRYDASSGALLASESVANDSITDLIALPDGAVAFASVDGSWGVTDMAGTSIRVVAKFSNLRGAAGLRISADARRVAWTIADSGKQKTFNLATRVISDGAASNLLAPVSSNGFFSGTNNWENHLVPEVNGRAVALAQDERSRSLAYIGNTGQALLGSSRAIRRIDEKGVVLWQVSAPAEVLAVNVGADDVRLFVTAMSDGTLRWYRLSDGQLLLTLYPSADGQWVIWTPNGYFDASAGADRLIGWSVNRGRNAAADFFSLGRFRDKYQRPDVIDLLFRTLDVDAALAQANEQVAVARQSAPSMPPSAPVAAAPVPAPPPQATAPTASPPKPLPTPLLKPQELPPSLAALESTLLRRAANSRVTLQFAVRAPAGDREVVVEVRVNGRPVEADLITLPKELDGQSRGLAQLSIADPDAVVQLIARNRFGVSEPLSFRIEREAAAAPPSAAGNTASNTKPPAQPATGVGGPSVSPPPAVATKPGAVRPRLFALSIGVSQYQREEYRLGLPAKDARDFVKAMERQKGALYSEVTVQVLADKDATRANIEKGLAWLSSSVGPGDIGMLFMAGHGLNEPGGQYYFLPYDGQHTKLSATSVPESAIRNTLGKIRGRALFFVDTCFAGNVVGGTTGALANTSRELGRLASELASSENGVVVFASSSGRQQSEEKDEWGNGAFTKALIDGLAGRADLTRNGQVTFKGLDFFVSEEVKRLTDGRQTPVTISPIGVPDFILARVSG